ncbi:methylated-DNA--[protein]-cysteine S-methyltransferase [Glaciibacter superstes]|uniref:methylated-DNA--[protein]-cysteine S-methyltransferase n=1 Tax=Glaciibacter superstes TaxID=501023 RepID=UPI0003B70503|nr:methylated-DNA--[protein]-cysteine S-methyltransferase [Glaciibacter superstes]
MSNHAIIDTPVGDLTLVGEDNALTGVYFREHRHAPDAAMFGSRDDAVFAAAAEQLAQYFAGERTSFDLPLAPKGDAFQQKVWALLRDIPYGETRSYGQLATALGDRNLSRAVGAANGKNPISIIVPCHRVIGADGNLVGYGGGLDRKRFLLGLEELEEVKVERLF